MPSGSGISSSVKERSVCWRSHNSLGRKKVSNEGGGQGVASPVWSGQVHQYFDSKYFELYLTCALHGSIECTQWWISKPMISTNDPCHLIHLQKHVCCKNPTSQCTGFLKIVSLQALMHWNKKPLQKRSLPIWFARFWADHTGEMMTGKKNNG